MGEQHLKLLFLPVDMGYNYLKIMEKKRLGTKKYIVAIVEDEKKLLDLLIYNLSAYYNVKGFLSAEDFLSWYEGAVPTVLVTDVRLPGIDGIELMKLVKKKTPLVPVIVITAYGSIDEAVSAIKEGAYDYVTKPVTVSQLRGLIDRGAELRSIIDVDAPLFSVDSGFITRDRRTMEELKLAARVSKTKVPIIILGETGTGKELVAEMIHAASGRKGKLVKINCAAIPSELLEGELFGHKRGAFTGAYTNRIGKLKLADGGTLFLDEIGEMSLALQAKLLRVIEENSFYAIGDNNITKVDLRIIAATNKDIKNEIEEGRFRADLYYRLAVVPIRIPPLRERKEDIVPLCEHFLHEIIKKGETSAREIDESVYLYLSEYDWPGNVRELRNVITHMALLASTERITIEEMPLEIVRQSKSTLKVPRTYEELKERKKSVRLEATSQIEKLFLYEILKDANWNVSLAARRARMDRRLLQNMIKKYGLRRKS